MTEVSSIAEPTELRRAAEEARADAARLLDLADEQMIRADLAERLNRAQMTVILAEGRVNVARQRHQEASAEMERAEGDQRERAERVRDKLSEELGDALAQEVADRVAVTALAREANERRAEVAEALRESGAPSLVVETALAMLDEHDRAQHAERQAALTAASTELSDAEAKFTAAQGEVSRLEAAIADPLDLAHFTMTESWLARMVRPQVYRAVISAKVNGGEVDELVYSLALTSARESWRLDAALAGDLDQLDAEHKSLAKLRTELDQIKRAARITPTQTAVSAGRTGWL